MNIISKKEAKEQNLKFFFTGKPCKRGHITERYLSGGHCVECAIAKSAAWRAANPDKAKSTAAKYRKENSEKIKASKACWLAANPEKAIAQWAAWKAANPEKVKANKAAWYEANKERSRARNLAWNKANPEKRKASNTAWRKANSEKATAASSAWNNANPESMFIRRSLKRILTNWKGGREKYEALLGYTCEDLKTHIERQFLKGMSWENRKEWHIDHIIPIAEHLKNGVTDPAVINCLTNLRPIWADANLRKGSSVESLL